MKKSLLDEARKKASALRENLSMAEKLLWFYLRNDKFHQLKFHKKFPVFYNAGKQMEYCITDFCCPEKMLLILIDEDIEKKECNCNSLAFKLFCQQVGYHILVFSNDDLIFHLDDVLETIRKTVV